MNLKKDFPAKNSKFDKNGHINFLKNKTVMVIKICFSTFVRIFYKLIFKKLAFCYIRKIIGVKSDNYDLNFLYWVENRALLKIKNKTNYSNYFY